MKKHLFFLTSILFLTLLLTGCSWFSKNIDQNQNSNQNENNNINEVAIVNQNENQNQNVNTRINENENNNINQETNQNINSDTNKNTNTEMDTGDWLTYDNEEYGFSFKYPSDWYMYHHNINTAIIPTLYNYDVEKVDPEPPYKGDYVKITNTFYNKEEKKSQGTITEILSCEINNEWEELFECKDYETNGYIYKYKVVDGNFDGKYKAISIATEKGGYIYFFSATLREGERQEELLNIVETIISTIKLK